MKQEIKDKPTAIKKKVIIDKETVIYNKALTGIDLLNVKKKTSTNKKASLENKTPANKNTQKSKIAKKNVLDDKKASLENKSLTNKNTQKSKIAKKNVLDDKKASLENKALANKNTQKSKIAKKYSIDNKVLDDKKASLENKTPANKNTQKSKIANKKAIDDKQVQLKSNLVNTKKKTQTNPNSLKNLVPCKSKFESDNIWYERFLELKHFAEVYGHCNVPRELPHPVYKLANFRLAYWVLKQRRLFHRGKLNEYKTHKLNTINFNWDPFQSKWDAHYLELVEYKKKHGDCLVPRPDLYPENRTFAKWVMHTRTYHYRLSEQRIKLLNDIGFVWVLKPELNRDTVSVFRRIIDKRLP